MRISRKSLALLLIGGGLALTSCSSLPLPDFGRAERAAERAEDKAGRISLALGDQRLEADPAFVDTAIVLPAGTSNLSWPQAGLRPSKVAGHFAAGAAFEIDWRVNAASGTDRNTALTAPPVSDGEYIYLLDGDQKVKSFSVETGRSNWTVSLQSGLRRDKRGVGGGVAVDDGTLFVASGFGFVVAMDASTGDEKWRSPLGAPVTSSPTVRDGQVFVVTQNNEVFALSAATGDVEWSDQAIAESARVLSSPSVAAIEDLVVAPFSSGEVIAYLSANGRRLWNDGLNRAGRFTPISSINDIASRPVLNQGLVYAASQSGILAAIDGRTGRRVWQQNIGSIFAPALVGEYMFVAGVDGQIACLSKTSGAVIWAVQLPEFEKAEKKRGKISYAGPIITSNKVVVASSTGDLVAISPQTGEETARLNLGDKVFLEPIAVGDRLIILTDEGRLIAVR